MEQSSAARERVWRQLGSLEPFALSQNASSGPLAGPKWPALRQNFRVIHRPNGNVMIVSDGLSDPFDDIHEGAQGGRPRGARRRGGAGLGRAQAPRLPRVGAR